MKNGPYELVCAPDGYPGKRYRDRYCYEHHLVWWQNTGEILEENEVLHHVDGNKRHNIFTNLVKLFRATHASQHAPAPAPSDSLVCAACGMVFLREHKQQLKGYKRTFCNRACMGKFFAGKGG